MQREHVYERPGRSESRRRRRQRQFYRILAAIWLMAFVLGLLCGKLVFAKETGLLARAGAEPEAEESENDRTQTAEHDNGTIDNPDGEESAGDWKLTLVNAMGTWCSPCVQELPELQKLYENMKDKGVGVISIVTDTLGADNKPDQATVEAAKKMVEKSGATYPFLVPDAGWLNGRLANMETFPESFFVDENGNIVGEPSFGSHDLAEWTSIVENELANLDQGALCAA